MAVDAQDAVDIRAVAIDLDGTLADSVGDIHAAVNLLRAEFDGAPLPLEQVARMVGYGSDNLVRQVLALDFPEHRVEAMARAYLGRYLDYYRSVNGRQESLYPEVVAGLETMRAHGLRLACVTNKNHDLAEGLLRHFALRDHFEVVYGGDSLAARKPDPLPLLRVCADFGIAPAQLVMIGDSRTDARTGRAAGSRVLVVPYGYNHGEPVQSLDSDGIVSTLLDAARRIISGNLRAANPSLPS